MAEIDNVERARILQVTAKGKELPQSMVGENIEAEVDANQEREEHGQEKATKSISSGKRGPSVIIQVISGKTGS